MMFFPRETHVRLRSIAYGNYLYADKDGESVSVDYFCASLNTVWAIENDGAFLRLRGVYGRYVVGTDSPAAPALNGYRIIQSEVDALRVHVFRWQPIWRGEHFFLRDSFGRLLSTNGRPSQNRVTSAAANVERELCNAMLWEVEVVGKLWALPVLPLTNKQAGYDVIFPRRAGGISFSRCCCEFFFCSQAQLLVRADHSEDSFSMYFWTSLPPFYRFQINEEPDTKYTVIFHRRTADTAVVRQYFNFEDLRRLLFLIPVPALEKLFSTFGFPVDHRTQAGLDKLTVQSRNRAYRGFYRDFDWAIQFFETEAEPQPVLTLRCRPLFGGFGTKPFEFIMLQPHPFHRLKIDCTMPGIAFSVQFQIHEGAPVQRCLQRMVHKIPVPCLTEIDAEFRL